MTKKTSKESLTMEELKKQIAELKKEIEDREWGIQKTNEGIKILYRELEKQNEELRKIDKLKSDFVSTVSHELRTPMTIIKESIAQILDGFAGDVTKEQEKLLSMAVKNIARLGRIVNNLLDIAKLEEGKVVLHKETFNLVELVNEVVLSFRAHIQKRGLEIKTDFFKETIYVYADRDKITQVLTNLVGNADKFTEKGSITISISQTENYIECSVADTGPGMKKEDIPKVFDKFKQFGHKSGSGEKGTGLGLAITKGIVELHGGSIWVNSKLNGGTVFTFTLPKHEGDTL